jgi:hypothetical protein
MELVFPANVGTKTHISDYPVNQDLQMIERVIDKPATATTGSNLKGEVREVGDFYKTVIDGLRRLRKGTCIKKRPTEGASRFRKM